jgi:hypothetical protein
MGMAVLVFSLVVGIFHLQGDSTEIPGSGQLSAAAELPDNYREPDSPTGSAPVENLSRDSAEDAGVESLPEVSQDSAAQPLVLRIREAATTQDLAQAVADLAAGNPQDAALAVKLALARDIGDRTLGDVSTLAAAATRSAPGQAPAIAGTVTRSLADSGDDVLAAAIATIVSLVPDQTRDIGLVVGAILGEDLDALAIVAQTVAIATGEATFSSLSESSGVSLASIMNASSRLGGGVPYDVPVYAAQNAPGASMVAGDDLPERELLTR